MKTLKSPFDYQNEIFDYPRQDCDFQNKTFELSNQILISKRNFQNETFDSYNQDWHLQKGLSQNDFQSGSLNFSMGTPNVERNFDSQHDLWNNVSISKIEIFIFKMNF